jgi:hypothetical protein
MVLAASATAVTLRGGWAPYNRCPVDDPAMLAADGITVVAACVVADSPNGSVKIGNTSVTTGDSNLQFGLLQNNATQPSTFSPVAPAGGALVAAPANVPGGLLGLMCPSINPIIMALCNQIVNNQLNTVTAVVQAAGAPSNVSFFAQFSKGVPILTLPIKIQLQNPILGSSCYLGTDSNPIVLHPENLTTPHFGNGLAFDANGTPDPNGILQSIVLNSTQGDKKFTVPGASGCAGLLSAVVDPVINLKLGLPSGRGSNSIVLNNSTTKTGVFGLPANFAPNEGRDLSADWHSAVLP